MSPEPGQRCETCRHWDPGFQGIGGEGYGGCYQLVEISEHDPLWNDVSRLVVPASFGCAEWEAQP